MLERLMQLVGLERRAAPAGTLASPWTTLVLGGAPTSTGMAVSPENALRCAPVAAVVKVLSETVSQLPVHLYRRLADGGRERAADHPVEPLLSDAANPWMPASEFRALLQVHLALFGNAFAFVNRNALGEIVELIPLDPRSVSVEPLDTGEPRYIVGDPGTGGWPAGERRRPPDSQRREYDRSEVLHIRSAGLDLHRGESPVHQAREAIALYLLLEQHGSGLFGRGARPSGALKHPKLLSEDAARRMRASWQSAYGGVENAGRTVLLEEGTDFVPMQLTSVDSQYLELRLYQLREIARVWRVPPVFVGDLERATFSNVEELGQQFLTFTILPILRSWQGALQLTLLTPDERAAGLFVDFVVDDLARANLNARFTAYSQAIAAGVFNPNEVRSMENRGSYPAGDVFTRPVNSAPVQAPRAQGGDDAAAG